jgi:hypothetical protein
MKLRLGKELYDRVKAIAEKYDKSMANIVERADRSWWKLEQGDNVAILTSKSFTTKEGSGGVISVKCDRDAKELKAIIDWYLLAQENASEVKVSTMPDRVISEVKAMERSYKKLNALTKIAEGELELKEIETETEEVK